MCVTFVELKYVSHGGNSPVVVTAFFLVVHVCIQAFHV